VRRGPARTVLLGGLTAILAVLLVEFGVFLCLCHSADRHSADLLAVYGGADERYAYGLRWEQTGDFKYLVFSDLSPDKVAHLLQTKGAPKQAEVLLEPEARSTEQNAQFVGRLLESRKCHSVVVVTAWWHLPRALLLSRWLWREKAVEVTGVACNVRPDNYVLDRKFLAELFKFWGSLGEWAVGSPPWVKDR